MYLEILGGAMVLMAVAFVSLRRMSANECQLSIGRLGEVFERIREEGRESSFAVFLFRTGLENDPDALNFQVSVERGVLGLDWVLNSPLNERECERFLGLAKSLGHSAELRESNRMKYWRVENGNLLDLGRCVLRDLYSKRDDDAVALVVEGFSWP